jgi:hypothetical protein
MPQGCAYGSAAYSPDFGPYGTRAVVESRLDRIGRDLEDGKPPFDFRIDFARYLASSKMCVGHVLLQVGLEPICTISYIKAALA